MSFIVIMRISLKKLLWGEKIIADYADYKDIKSQQKICHSYEFLARNSSKSFSCKSCGCNISMKIMFATAECPEGKWNMLNY